MWLTLISLLPPNAKWKVQSPESGAASVKQKDLWFESSTTLNEGEDQVLIGISTSQHNSSLSRRGRGETTQTLYVDVVYSPKLLKGSDKLHVVALICHILTSVSGSPSPEAACSCVSQRRHPVSAPRGNINEQIATTLLRLQHDMADVLHRLHTLEVLSTSQVKDQGCRPQYKDIMKNLPLQLIEHPCCYFCSYTSGRF